MNYNYPGSIAEYNMNFASTVDVIIDEKSELFNAISIYVPMSLADANILDFDPSWVSVRKPAVITCTLDNYKKYMKGKLLDQWQPVFRQDTNFDVILYLIVFLDDESTSAMWDIDEVSIKFGPITEAFNKLYFISYVKTLFDGTYDGKAGRIAASPGTKASGQIVLTNIGADAVTINPGIYTFSDGVKDWVFTIDTATELAVGGDWREIPTVADTVGANAVLQAGDLINNTTPGLPADIKIEITSVTQGTGAVAAQTAPSKFFDHALALAYMCKQDIKLSYFINMVRITYVDDKPNPNDLCWVRYASFAQELNAMKSIADNDRAKYYWGALYLMGCVKNTWTLVHSEPVNIVPLIFEEWFRERNDSGQYVGGELYMLRLKGTRVKPCGYPSWLNDAVNENDRDGISLLREKKVGFLRTIADNTVQESCLDTAMSIDGTPVGAQMISKFVDYACAQDCAKFVTEEGNLTDPVLTNETAYKKIQGIVSSKLGLFSYHLTNITLKFPVLSVAKVGPRELRAARVWAATYSDRLTTITVTGGMTA